MCGRLTLNSDEPEPEQLLARLAYAKGISGRPTPMQPIPLITGPESCLLARWGWPSSRGGILTHVRSETAATLPTWRDAWRSRRGVVPVAGWEEGSWLITAPGAHLAVLWTAIEDDVRLAILTQPPPPAHLHIERFPVPLTQAGAVAWLSGGGLDGQTEKLTVAGKNGQQTIFS
jgi:putative SOS response-associated peptidase YedK